MKIESFFNIYFLFIIIIGIITYVTLLSTTVKKNNNNKVDYFFYVLSLLFILFFFGLRNEEIGTDTSHYLYDFHLVSRFNNFTDALKFSTIKRDMFFVLFTYISTKFMSAKLYIFVLAGIYLLLINGIIKKLAKQQRLIVLFTFLCFGFFYGMGINILRSGLSVMFSLLGLLYLFDFSNTIKTKKKYLGFVFLTIGILFHSSAIIFILIYFLVKIIRLHIKWYYLGTLFFLILAYFKFSIKNLPIIGSIVEQNERLEGYVSGESIRQGSGFNLYVIMFQVLGILYGYYFIKRYRDENYILINKIYLALSCFYFMCLDVSYSERFGVMSWVWLPILLLFPFFKEGKLNLNKDFYKYIFVSLTYLLLTYYRVSYE